MRKIIKLLKKLNVFDLNEVKILDLLEGSMPLAGIGWHYGINESSICSTVLNSMQPKQ
jgi:hypothetical protein